MQIVTSFTAKGLPAGAWDNYADVPEASAALAHTSIAEVDGTVAVGYGDESAGLLKYANRFD
ncbi:MAG: hypothetical protein H7A35_01965 [Planctomycetales bacterium]|nr:hypothetical protein [bacterium]UNM08825.1 MAG: hypothetical protein H7A35_01965 [Planctomycetales bacterium]